MHDGDVPQLLTVSEHHYGGIVVVEAVGEIDITSAAVLSSALEAVAPAAEAVIVDLSAVGFMGSVGFTVLLAAAENRGPRQLRVVVSPQVRRPLEMMGLDKVLDLYHSLDLALGDGPGATA
ncbi:STAS domain-containing protein [Nocardia aurantia]|uniref:Anti-sigma factor antagonist n=1 Tax=Nocardia aurantia TaxID=2585199 RepID=A0A7K0DJV5_9NOCA|nr:STAS domain-containing protein [Nocardia aurantia]MQY26090.1 Anti-sigma-F factor antagonist RsfB [Nocardia aurantia]